MSNESTPVRLIVALSSLAAFLAVCSPQGLGAGPALAKSKPGAKEATDKPRADSGASDASASKSSKSGKAEKSGASDKSNGGKPELLGSYADWGAYAAQASKSKTCYALGQPKDRQPKAKLKDTSAYVFISTRPGEGVRNEVAINLGYPTKDGSAATALIDGAEFELITKGTNAWVKDQSKEREFVGALRGGSKLVVKASSAKGTSTTDTYSLKGLSDALARVVQECK